MHLLLLRREIDIGANLRQACSVMENAETCDLIDFPFGIRVPKWQWHASSNPLNVAKLLNFNNML